MELYTERAIGVVHPAADDFAVVHKDAAYWYFIRDESGLCHLESRPHEPFVLKDVARDHDFWAGGGRICRSRLGGGSLDGQAREWEGWKDRSHCGSLCRSRSADGG